MKTGGLDRMIGHKYTDKAAFFAEIEARGGLLVSHTHFELNALDSDGRRVRYQLATEADGSIEVVRRAYE